MPTLRWWWIDESKLAWVGLSIFSSIVYSSLAPLHPDLPLHIIHHLLVYIILDCPSAAHAFVPDGDTMTFLCIPTFYHLALCFFHILLPDHFSYSFMNIYFNLSIQLPHTYTYLNIIQKNNKYIHKYSIHLHTAGII